MKPLLGFSQAVDWLNQLLGKACDWLVLLACVVSAGNAMVRYAYDISSNAWLEAQWYMFAVIVMLGASYTLKKNEHVRVDLWYMTLSRRGQIWVDIIGTVLFLIPTCLLLAGEDPGAVGLCAGGAAGCVRGDQARGGAAGPRYSRP